jgi:hypothetical protein
MATFEELVYQRLSTTTALTSILATYGSAPAVFSRQAPDDMASGWNGIQYPRVEFWINFFGDPERVVEGTFSLDATIAFDGGTPAMADTEELEAALIECLSSCFFETDRGIIALSWHRTDPAQYHKMNPSLAIDRWLKSITMDFDIAGFPEQPLGDPNPIDGLLDATRKILTPTGAFYVNGELSGTNIWRPLSNKPAIYWRVISRQVSAASGTDLSYDVEIKGHVMVATYSDRFRYCSIIQDGLRCLSGIPLRNGTVMSLTKTNSRMPVVFGANSITNGQINIGGSYRVSTSAKTPRPTLETVTTSAVNLYVGTKY